MGLFISPFTGLDAFERGDAARYFGRAAAVAELYNRVQSGKLTLVYGLSGTGKSSLVRCGLANRFRSEDWLPVTVRRGADINAAISEELYAAWRATAAGRLDQVDAGNVSTPGGEVTLPANALPPGEERPPWLAEDVDYLTTNTADLPPATYTEFSALGDLETRIERVYYAVYRPIYLIFDQFEELYTINPHLGEGVDFADARAQLVEEQRKFYRTVRALLDSTRVSVRICLIVREEWWARMNEFERFVPELNQNRMRLERMGDVEMAEVLRRTAAFSQASKRHSSLYLGDPNAADDGEREATIAAILRTLRDEKDHSLDLVDMQIYMERLMQNSIAGKGNNGLERSVVRPAVVEANRMDNVIGNFLRSSLRQIEGELITRWREAEPELANKSAADRAASIPLEVLFRMVTDQGTKRNTPETEILNAPLFARRGIMAEDLRFILDRLTELKIINQYQTT